jgi:hypothetical protein
MGADTRARAIALLLATFAAGAITGASVWPRVEGRRGVARVSREPESERIPLPLETLGLTTDERAHLHAIARRWRPRADSEWNEVRRSVADMENGMFAEMLCALTPQQQQQYLDMTRREQYDTTLVNKRFAIVRANGCGELTTAWSTRRDLPPDR